MKKSSYMDEVKRILTLVGDPNQVTTRGGQPFFFLQVGKEMGFFTSGLELKPEKLQIERIFWNIWSLLTTGQKGGFQYSDFFLNRLIMQGELSEHSLDLISYFPLLPPGKWTKNWKVSYYIDATLMQNFKDYGLASKISKKIQKKALKQECNHYLLAQRIICRSRWAATSVINDYGVSPNKVHVVLPGASIDENIINKVGMNPSPPLTPLRLGFIGMDWKRKRLPFLLKVAEVLEKRGISVEVVVIGPDRQDLPSHHLMKPVGFINKQKQMEEFIKLVQSFHFGCLFSSVEGQGQSILESLRLGVPVLGANASGIPDGVPEGLGFLFALDSPPAVVADVLQFLVENPSMYYSLRQRVTACAEQFSWKKTVINFINLWQGSENFLYDKIAAN
ncbi:glycosyltransferase family 4 protein [Oxynema sp. CENA135]|uniref:glycosyltransferase family 4 protein n=1 Tax=Oxynema sp. CENA135 TaxID=984206 RepID=UPI00190D1532|nr:glycosyltransferase family 4 protein [Oxynema sp. CENA135]MBK4728706.1 glycosyltransferase family 4 protein [Oxynema sp. CENA135]